jgi:hypothetical protein
MKLIEFKEQTVVIAKDQPEYEPLPAHVFEGESTGRIACCWKLTWWERIKLLFTGRVWHQVLTFGRSLQPQLLTVEKPDMRPLFVRWWEELRSLAKEQGVEWLLGDDAEIYRGDFEHGLTPERVLQEEMQAAAGDAE